MKKILTALAALALILISTASCNKYEVIEDEPINITGTWKYSGFGEKSVDDLDFNKNYLFMINGNLIQVFDISGLNQTAEYTYTMEKNVLTFTPAFNGKYTKATVFQTYGGGNLGMCWDCGNNQTYFFDPKN